MRRLVLLLVVAAVSAACAAPAGETPSSAASGRLVDGSVALFQQQLEDARGMPAVVNFWATWCVPCRQEMPRLVEAAHTYEGRVFFLGVDVEDDRSAAQRFIEEYSIPFLSLFDDDGQIRRSERVLGLPVTQFYRADGELAFVHNGEISEEDLIKNIQETLRAS